MIIGNDNRRVNFKKSSLKFEQSFYFLLLSLLILLVLMYDTTFLGTKYKIAYIEC